MKNQKRLKPKILVIVGTIRKNRVGVKVANWYIREAKKSAPDLDFELFDVKEQNLPLFNEAIPPAQYKYGELQQRLAKHIGAADGFVFIVGEYNFGIPGSLKNFFDYFGPREWQHKAATYVGYGAAGAFRSIDQLWQIMAALRVASVANWDDTIHIDHMWTAFDEEGNLKTEHIRYGSVEKQLKEFSWWVYALKAARER